MKIKNIFIVLFSFLIINGKNKERIRLPKKNVVCNSSYAKDSPKIKCLSSKNNQIEQEDISNCNENQTSNSENSTICPHCNRAEFILWVYASKLKKKYKEYLASVKQQGETIAKKGVLAVEGVYEFIVKKIVSAKELIGNISEWAHK